MCLYSRGVAVQASLDIVVYKMLNVITFETKERELRTPYENVIVELNKPIYAKRKFSDGIIQEDGLTRITAEGVHAYLDYNEACYYCNLHTILFDSKYSETKLFKAIIPKGAFFWVGTRNDVASTKLIVTEKLYK